MGAEDAGEPEPVDVDVDGEQDAEMMSPPTVRRIARSTVMTMPPAETGRSYIKA